MLYFNEVHIHNMYYLNLIFNTCQTKIKLRAITSNFKVRTVNIRILNDQNLKYAEYRTEGSFNFRHKFVLLNQTECTKPNVDNQTSLDHFIYKQIFYTMV